MKLTQLDQVTYEELERLWSNTDPERPDNERGRELLRHMLFDDGGASIWHIVPPSGVFVITNLQSGLGEYITPVALYTVDAETAKAELRSVMREYDLRRISAFVPAPIHSVQRNLVQIGFAQEGILRDGTVYDTAFTDQVIFGLHRSEVEAVPLPIAGPAGKDVGKKRRRRRRRSRRKKGQNGKTEK